MSLLCTLHLWDKIISFHIGRLIENVYSNNFGGIYIYIYLYFQVVSVRIILVILFITRDPNEIS